MWRRKLTSGTPATGATEVTGAAAAAGATGPAAAARAAGATKAAGTTAASAPTAAATTQTPGLPWLARLARSRLFARLPPHTLRLRLSVLYGSLFFASGAALLAITYALVEPRPPVQYANLLTSDQLVRTRLAIQRILGGRQATHALKTLVEAQRADTLHQLTLASGIALALMTLVSAWLGWLMAGRALRPLQVMGAKAGPADELKELGDTFDGLLGRLEAAFSAQRQFVANASHELRTPLTLERAMVEVALADPDAPAQVLRATCQRVLAAGAQQERIIDALLTLARGQRGLDRREPFDLDEVAADVLAERGPGAERVGLRVEASLGSAPTSGDPRLAERLVANLVDNALVHNSADGWVTVHTGVKAGRAVLLVTNSGPVVAPGEVDRLLRPFERMRTDRTGQRAGLGLAIVQAIANAHGATLAVRPPGGGGLEVEVGFPVQAQARGAADSHAATWPAGTAGRSRD
jgi:signal transduction histidine kinase